MERSILAGANLSSAVFEYCELRGAQVSGATVEGASFRYTTLEGTGIQGVTRGVATYSYCPGIEGDGGMEGGFDEEPARGPILCTACGSPHEGGRFCTKCGLPLPAA